MSGEQPSAREQFTSFYGATTELIPDSMKPVGELLSMKADYLPLLSSTMGLGQFPEIFDALVGGLEKFSLTVEEQLAASELTDRFGKPESLLAVPVFFDLVAREVGAKIDAAKNAWKAEEALRQARVWLGKFAFLIKLELAQIENELEAHQAAKDQLTDNKITHARLSTTRDRVKAKFSLKLAKLETKQKALIEFRAWLDKLSFRMSASSRPITIFSNQEIASSLVLDSSLLGLS